ncbi:MAG: 2,3,4,5-tetrahydropyridine-2,6-dicarboxylate N-succinyltransferase [Planctomycetota bacterium]
MTVTWTHDALHRFYARPTDQQLADPAWEGAHAALLRGLEDGSIRAAARGDDGVWRANAWVKEAILLGFRRTSIERIEATPAPFHDKTAYPVRAFHADDRVRVVPGGTSVRRGAFVAPSVVIMPPAYINVGAYVAAGTMVDSHALVGSCAQIGARVHLSAGAQIGGVLEPAGARPVVIEDDAFVGALAGVFEGVCVRERAVLAPGVILTGSTVIYDLVHDREWRGEVPAGAVVVPGTRPARGAAAERLGLALACAVIVKVRDARTDAATALEDALR